MAQLPWKPWHTVVALREDLKGDLSLSSFAADLYEVLMRRGKMPVYEDPQKFFALTFPTHNLRQLVRDVALRLANKNDKAVRQLELTYGGGKTHTLVTLTQLFSDPDSLPNLPAVGEFKEAVGEKKLPRARVAGLCFDKLDIDTGMDVRGPDGTVRKLHQPWSVLAYQLAGDAGLKVMHAKGKAEERDTAPAENTLTELLELPWKEGLATLILMDEVMMFAKGKVIQNPNWRDILLNFFQAITQAATKVPRCCIVASLLATDPKRTGDELGRQLLGDFADIFRRQREEAVEPVVKEDVAEVLRRRFFTPESIKDTGAFRQHVIAALKGISAVDEQTAKAGATAEERVFKSYPFHPDLTEVLYAKWTQMRGFQRTRGVLRTFALALREAAKWDESPLIGPAAFLNAPGEEDMSEAMRELVTVADTEEHEGRKTAWTPIVVSELARAREVGKESVGLKWREIEQAVVATFLHSQPVGQSARTRDLTVLVGPCRPDKIELEKGLLRWTQLSHWLDDTFAPGGNELPGSWRLGNRPNLNQMHAVASKSISDEVVRARLLDEIGKAKKLTQGASAAGVKVHTLPDKPKDVEDDGSFRYAVLGPKAACDSGKTVQIDKGGYFEPVAIPKASQAAVEKGVAAAVEAGVVWMRSGPASLLGEPVPAGVLTPGATLAAPPAVIPAAEILPENLPDAWKGGETTALAVSSSLSQKVGTVLPWKTVRDAIGGALSARFAELVDGSAKWPCEMHAAGTVRLKVVTSSGAGSGGTGVSGGSGGSSATSKVLTASAYLEPSQIQDLADVVQKLVEIKAKSKVPIQFRIQVEVGDGTTPPPKPVAAEVTKILGEVSGELQLR